MINKEHTDSQQSIVERRNRRLLQLFQYYQLPVEIKGNPNAPFIIYKDMCLLSCYVHNFNFYITSLPYEGEEIFHVKLQQGKYPDRQLFLNKLFEAVHRRIFKIKIRNTDLYLAGYNFIDSARDRGRYPVFARYNYKIYFGKKMVEHLIYKLSMEGYSCEVEDSFYSDGIVNHAEIVEGEIKDFIVI